MDRPRQFHYKAGQHEISARIGTTGLSQGVLSQRPRFPFYHASTVLGLLGPAAEIFVGFGFLGSWATDLRAWAPTAASLSLSPHPFWCRMSTSITQKLMKSFHKRYSSDQAAHSGFSISSPTDLDLASRLSHGRFGSLIGKPTSQAKQVSNPYACSAGRTLALTSTARSSISTTAGRSDGCCLTQTQTTKQTRRIQIPEKNMASGR